MNYPFFDRLYVMKFSFLNKVICLSIKVRLHYARIRDSRFVTIRCPIEWIRLTNDECELYEFSLHTIHKLHTNYAS